MSVIISFCKLTHPSLITIFITVVKFRLLFLYAKDVQGCLLYPRDSQDALIYSRGAQDDLVCSRDAQDAFRPDSCRSEIHSLTSVPKLESETKQRNLKDPTVNNCLERSACWQNGKSFGRLRNSPPFIESHGALPVLHSLSSAV
jgi:hypothetical protein